MQISESIPTKHLRIGVKKVGTAVLTLAGEQPNEFKSGVIVKAHNDNTGIVYVGPNERLTANKDPETGGFPLAAGEAITIPVTDPSEIYMRADAASQYVAWMGA